MRVAVISTPGPGHINHIHDHLPSSDHKTFVVRYKDDPIASGDVILTYNASKPSHVAKVFNEERSKKLVDVLHCSVYEYQPHLIIYDFFALEGREVALRLGVPAVCYIPATLKPDEGPGSTCSDGYLPIERMYWVLRPPHPTALAPHVQFVLPKLKTSVLHIDTSLPILIVTFGTVVPRYTEYDEKVKRVLADVASLEGYRVIYIGLSAFVKSSIETNDLISYMNIADAVLFHGGGNTYAELLTLSKGIKAIVCPFFGDQFETARQIGCTYSGNIAEDIKSAPRLYCDRNPELLKIGVFSDYWKRGDLLFGQKLHRRALQLNYPDIDLHLEHYKPFQQFSSGNALPAIADVYNDEHRNTEERPKGEFSQRFEDFVDVVGQHPVGHEHELVHRCIKLLELTVTKWSGTIHFVIGEGVGPATQIELDYIRQHWDRLNEHIIFYDTSGARTCAPFERPQKIRTPCSTTQLSRTKTMSSILEKMYSRHIPVLDKFGSRLVYLDKTHLKEVLAEVDASYDVVVESQAGRVFHFYYLKKLKEVQVWPLVYLRYFCRDSSGAHEPTNRKFQSDFQDLVDSCAKNEKLY